MGGGIDAASQPGDHGESGTCKLEGELAGGLATIVGEFTRADDTNGVKIALFELSPDVEDGGGVERIAKSGGVVLVFLGEDLNIPFSGEGDFGRRVGEVFPIGDDFGDFRSDPFDPLEGGVGLLENTDGRAKVLDEAPDFNGTGFRELVECDESFGFSHGRGVSTGRVVRGKDSRRNRKGLRDRNPDKLVGGLDVARRI